MEQQNNQTNASKASWIIAGIAALGLISLFLPWFKVSIFGFSSSVSGLGSSLLNWVSLIGFLCVGIFAITNKAQSAAKWISVAVTALILIAFLANKDALDFGGSLGIGFYISIITAVALDLIHFNVIKLK